MDRRTEVSPGMEVACRDGHPIGHVKQLMPDGLYFQVDCRFAPDLYIPLDVIHDSTDGVVHLNVTHAESMNLGWEAKPGQ